MLVPEVAKAIVLDNYRMPIYMITGVKIARGATVNMIKEHEVGGKMHLGVHGAPAGVPGAVGPKVAISSKKTEGPSFRDSSDFVFAYRLREIFYQKGQVKHKEYNKGALYTSSGEEEELPMKPGEAFLEVNGLDHEDLQIDDQRWSKEVIVNEDEDICEIMAPQTKRTEM